MVRDARGACGEYAGISHARSSSIFHFFSLSLFFSFEIIMFLLLNRSEYDMILSITSVVQYLNLSDLYVYLCMCVCVRVYP